jgi:hypothetical protein
MAGGACRDLPKLFPSDDPIQINEADAIEGIIEIPKPLPMKSGFLLRMVLTGDHSNHLDR